MGEEWAELQRNKTLDLGDRRLDARAVLLVERLAGKPTESIPSACSGWAETQGAYRLLSNTKTDWQALLEPHWACSEERMRAHAVVLNIQDTTELDFNGRTTAGLGPLSYEAQRGMYLHPTYAVSPAREPLGVLDAWMWAREAKGKHGKRGRIVESARWIEGYERVAERALALPQVRQVCVADREADILALPRRAQELQHAADYLIAASTTGYCPTMASCGSKWRRRRCWAKCVRAAGRTRQSNPAGHAEPAGTGRRTVRWQSRQLARDLPAGAGDRPAGRRQACRMASSLSYGGC
ncbi:transposase DNA-binding-containing protein [Pseudorhodoferax sp.]|uniref:IS4/Tn5 family transposase DNA-binding protein n=1 Tax=Pseudorhodoferax sp. TaxID=1993553 RepID=UPI0039E457A9